MKHAITHDAPLKWCGDNIGLTGRDEPIVIELHEAGIVALDDALAKFSALDDYGRRRITSALALNAENGYLCSADLAVWKRWNRTYARRAEVH